MTVKTFEKAKRFDQHIQKLQWIELVPLLADNYPTHFVGDNEIWLKLPHGGLIEIFPQSVMGVHSFSIIVWDITLPDHSQHLMKGSVDRLKQVIMQVDNIYRAAKTIPKDKMSFC